MWTKNKTTNAQHIIQGDKNSPRSETSKNTNLRWVWTHFFFVGRGGGWVGGWHRKSSNNADRSRTNNGRAATRSEKQRLDTVRMLRGSHFGRTQVEGPERTGAAAARPREAREWCSHAIKGRKKRRGRMEWNGWRDVCVWVSAVPRCGGAWHRHQPLPQGGMRSLRDAHTQQPIGTKACAAQWMKWNWFPAWHKFFPWAALPNRFFMLFPAGVALLMWA